MAEIGEACKLFISYARADRSNAEALHSHLKPLVLSGKLELFFDTESIEKGELWDEKISGWLQQADAFIFLISRHYFDSEYVINTELPNMLRRYRKGEVKCWPFYLSAYAWEHIEIEKFRLGRIQAIGPFDQGENLAPLKQLSEHEQDAAFIRVYQEIVKWVESREPRQSSNAEKKNQELPSGNKKIVSPPSKESVPPAKAGKLETGDHADQNRDKLKASGDAREPTSRNSANTSTTKFKTTAAVIIAMFLIAVVIYLNRDYDLKEQELATVRDTLMNGGKGPEMIVIPTGSFLMGSAAGEKERGNDEGPQHEVGIGTFAIGKTEVTFDEYDRFARANERNLPDDNGWGRGQRPVINVSWNDAIAYTEWLSEQTAQQYRLPSEAEWEYAARAGTTTLFSSGSCIDTDQANYNGNFDYAGCGANTGVYRQKTVPVDDLGENPWGLKHMHGNVWEWTRDCWHDNYQGAPADGSVWQEGGDCVRRVVRGGGWFDEPRSLRSAYRYGFFTDDALYNRGFRLARTL